MGTRSKLNSKARQAGAKAKARAKETLDQFLIKLNESQIRKKVDEMIDNQLDHEVMSDMSLRQLGFRILNNIESVRDQLEVEALKKRVQRAKPVRHARVAKKKTQKTIQKALSKKTVAKPTTDLSQPE